VSEMTLKEFADRLAEEWCQSPPMLRDMDAWFEAHLRSWWTESKQIRSTAMEERGRLRNAIRLCQASYTGEVWGTVSDADVDGWIDAARRAEARAAEGGRR